MINIIHKNNSNSCLFLRRNETDCASQSSSQISNIFILNEFECLLGESSTNYPKDEAVENIKIKVDSTAIDTEVYGEAKLEKKQLTRRRIVYNEYGK